MTFNVIFESRDFSRVFIPHWKAKPIHFSWSCFGGPNKALIHLSGDPQSLVDSASLLRSSVKIYDPFGVACWWGFVNKVVIHFEGTRFTISLDELFNRVKVSYSFTSPDHQVSDNYETAFAEDSVSKTEYGIKEQVLFYTNIDDDFALSVRDTFLETHNFPKTKLDTRINSSNIYATLYCSGWFETLGWKYYSNSEGFYANYGPGPGVHKFSYPNFRTPAQSIFPTSSLYAKHIWFRLNKVGSPTSDPYARIYSNNANAPNVSLVTSAAVSRALIPTVGYSWFCFSLATPYLLSAGAQYWVAVRSNATDSSNYYQIRTDETNENAGNTKKAMYNNGATWVNIPNITAPGNLVSLYYRVVCIQDSGTQLFNIATAGNQFFNHIWSFTTGTNNSPYLQEQTRCLDQIKKIMLTGTINNRLILAKVSEQRNLTFYEQPDPDSPTIYLSRVGKFYTEKGIQLHPWIPPVGHFAILSHTAKFTLPFDKNRLPNCFIRNATYWPEKNQVLINH